jgi:protein gp37
MGTKTKIDWCDSSWNPVTGCLHDCDYCYARGIAKRFGGWTHTPGGARANISSDKTFICLDTKFEKGKDYHPYYGSIVEVSGIKIADIKSPFLNESKIASYAFGFTPTFHRYRLNQPQAWKTPRTIFVGSMCDLFGAWVPDDWIQDVFDACAAAPQHRYLFLTKNPKRYVELENRGLLRQDDNFWFGYSATHKSELWQVEHADEIPIKHLFVSIEPILEDFRGVAFSTHCPTDWIIVGAETGKRKGKVKPRLEWLDSLVTQSVYGGAPLFMKNGEIINAEDVKNGAEPKYFMCELMGDNFRQEFPWEATR